MQSGSLNKILIIYKFLPQWRVDFFNRLKDALLNEGIELSLVYGKLKGQVSKKNDEVDLDWANYLPNKFIKFGKLELIWQPALKYILKSDLIIVEQANKLIINYFLIILRKLTKKKFAFWGHGLNLQDNPNSFANKFKRIYSKQCDWWFAYTKNVSKTVKSIGFPENRITIVQNAIDTKYLLKIYNEITEFEIMNIKEKFSIGDGPIGLYCGGMYKEKRLDFLLESCENIKKEIPSFEMIFLGGGPEEYKIKDKVNSRKWIHYIGPKFNNDKVPFFKIADVFLMPGLVGLAILDSFAMQTPLITTNYPFHSPEIEYLENGINGIITENNIENYSRTVIHTLNNKVLLEDLKKGCNIVAQKYTLENMVSNFSKGVLKCCNTL